MSLLNRPPCSLCAEHGWNPDTITLPSGVTLCLLHDTTCDPATWTDKIKAAKA